MSELIQCPIISSPPSPPPASRPANTAVRDGNNFEDVLKAQMESDKSSETSNETNTTSTNSSVKAVRTDSQSKANQGENISNLNNEKDETEQVLKVTPAAIEVNTDIAYIAQPVQIIAEQPQAVQVNIVETGMQNPDVAVIEGDAVAATATLPTQISSPVSSPAKETSSPEILNAQNVALQQVSKTIEDSSAVDVQESSPNGSFIQKDDGKVSSTSARNEQAVEASVKAPGQAASETNTDKPTPGQNKVAVKAEPGQIAETTVKNVEVSADKPPQVQAPPGESPGRMVGGVATTQVENPVNQAIEPDRLAEAQTTNIIGQIARQMEKLTQTGRQTLRIQLYPHELGHIDLKITTTSQGVGVTMLADNPVTGKLLEGQMAQLRQNLTDAGIQIANMQIGTQSNQQSNQGTFQNPNQTPARYTAPTVSTEVTGGEPVRLIESLIDYKI